MSPRSRRLTNIVSGFLAWLLLTGAAWAQDPVKVAPEFYKVLLENDRIRVLDIHMPSGGRSPMHSHPDYLVYSLSDATVRFTSPEGKTQDVALKNGQALWRDAESHAVENIGKTEAHVLNIELKSVKDAAAQAQIGAPSDVDQREPHVLVKPDETRWSPGPPSLPAGAQMAVLEGDPARSGPFTIRFKAPAGYRIAPHWHPKDEHVTVISGQLHLGMGDKFDSSGGGETLPAGGFSLMPAGMHHFAWTTEETVVQLHGIGPWGINYIDPTDDPRNQQHQAEPAYVR